MSLVHYRPLGMMLGGGFGVLLGQNCFEYSLPKKNKTALFAGVVLSLAGLAIIFTSLGVDTEIEGHSESLITSIALLTFIGFVSGLVYHAKWNNRKGETKMITLAVLYVLAWFGLATTLSYNTSSFNNFDKARAQFIFPGAAAISLSTVFILPQQRLNELVDGPGYTLAAIGWTLVALGYSRSGEDA